MDNIYIINKKTTNKFNHNTIDEINKLYKKLKKYK